MLIKFVMSAGYFNQEKTINSLIDLFFSSRTATNLIAVEDVKQS